MEKSATKESPRVKAPAVAPIWDTKINGYGDVHLKKAMIESAQQISGIAPGTPMKMTFAKGKIIIVPK